MTRFKNRVTGAIVNVPDEKGKRLGHEWGPADAPAAKVERSESPDGTWKVAELREFAEQNGIDLGDATKKADVLAVIDGASGGPADAPAGGDE